jgi:hypothetical protein
MSAASPYFALDYCDAAWILPRKEFKRQISDYTRVTRRTMLAALSASAALVLPARSDAATTKVALEISNQTGTGFQTYIKSLGNEYSVPTPPRITTKASVDASDQVLLLFETGSHGVKKRAYSVNVPDDAGKTMTVKILTKMDEKGVVVASADGAQVDEISVLIYLNS